MSKYNIQQDDMLPGLEVKDYAAGYDTWMQAKTAREALAVIRRDAPSDTIKGLRFEKLFAHIAPSIPELQVADIWRPSEWPAAYKHGLDGRDIGVDLVAKLKSGETVAVQCKCFNSNHLVSKGDIQKFLSGSQNKAFDRRWIVATSDLNSVAWQMIQRTNIRYLDFQQFYDCPISGEPLPLRQPWPLQQEAIDAVVEGFANPNNSGRGRLIMACGTGKTFTALRIAERLIESGGRILFLAPSIALVAQARREWLTHSQRSLHCAVVCSDKSIGRDGVSLVELSFSVTTDAAAIAEQFQSRPKSGVAVVFCTYQSIEVVADAQRQHGMGEFDLALIDEAHRTAGLQHKQAERRLFQRIHDQHEVACKKRLYMTATPRVYTDRAKKKAQDKDTELEITDMNDTAIYGPRFYRLTFRQAVDAGMLCDVRVVCLGLSEEILEDTALMGELEHISDTTGGAGKRPGTPEYLATLTIGMALNGWIEGEKKIEIPQNLPKTLAYANTIRRSAWLAQALQSETVQSFLQQYRQRRSRATLEEARPIHAQHLDGTSLVHERNRAIYALNTADSDTAEVITNCRLFTEGVDVPNLNAVAFMDPRSSATDIIQAVGRVMRKGAGDKKLGYIITPFWLSRGESVVDALQRRSDNFNILGKVLRALQSHDEDMFSKLPQILMIDSIQDEEQGRGEEKERGVGKNVNDDSEQESEGEMAKVLTDQLQLLEDPDAMYTFVAKYSGLGNPGKLVADTIIAAVKRAARIFLEEQMAPTLAETLGSSVDFLNSLSESERDKRFNEVTHTAALIIVNACLMHRRLEATGALGTLRKLEKMGSKADVVSLLIEDWQRILQKDYRPIFGQALTLLHYLRMRHGRQTQLQTALHTLINCAVDASASLNELGYDHAGPLYHTILEDAPSQGAFYTKNQSALLMSKLVFHDRLIDWNDAAAVKALRVIDPCCGTGTLLMAGLTAIRQQAMEKQQLDDTQRSALHKMLVEDCIYGLDINSRAVQLAACNLTLGAPDVNYEQMNMHSLEYGMMGGADDANANTVRHGALELLHQMDFTESGSQHELNLDSIAQALDSVNVMGEKDRLTLPPAFDVVMMNPPFTDTSRLQEQFPKAVAKAMAARLRALSDTLGSKSEEARTAIGKMSVGPFFTPLVEQLLHRTRGTLAKIIPTTALTSRNGADERRYMAQHFHIDMVVTSHDPKQIAFSASTSIHESMLIARRSADKSAPTRFVQLARMPVNSKEVAELAQRIQRDAMGEWGSITLWPAERIAVGDWSAVQWYDAELAEAAQQVLHLDGLAVSGKRYGWSPGGQEFRGMFDYDTNVAHDDERVNTYCSTSEKCHRTLASPPDTWAQAKANKEAQAERLLRRGGHVLVPCRLRVTNCRTFAVYSEQPAIGSAFRPIDDAATIPPARAKAYAVFLNSTFGALQILNMRTSKLDYPSYETGHLKQLRLPAAATEKLRPLTALFDAVRDTELMRLSAADRDPIRRQLDHTVAALLGVDTALTDRWRALLAQEPTITNRRYGVG